MGSDAEDQQRSAFWILAEGGCAVVFTENEKIIARNISKENKGDKMITREEILAEAKNCICGERENDYGSPEDNFAKISKLWTAYLEKEISSIDVAVMMCLFKVARMSGPNRGGIDSFVDLAGHAACGGEIFSKLHEISS